MAWLTALLGGLFGAGRNVITETVEAFRPNAEAADARGAEAQAAALAQMAGEFGRQGWFNGLVDGLNRLPRPMLAFGCIGLFAAAMADPIWFAARMQGLALMPEPMWAILGAIIAFYFGAREMHKLRAGNMAREATRILAQAPAVVANIRKLEALRADSPGAADTGRDANLTLSAVAAADNPALEAWRAETGR